MNDAFFADAGNLSNRRIRKWYQENLMQALLAAKEKRARDIDASIALASELLQVLDEPRCKSKPQPVYNLEPCEEETLMKPIEPEVLDLIYGSTEKGATERYFRVRYKKIPEDRFYFRETSNWDYGWQQKHAHTRARDVNRGRCAILRDTFYRKNNLGPDPPHYALPAGGQFSICSEYSCHFS